MNLNNKQPTAGAKGFAMVVLPERARLEMAIAEGGQCRPDKCWHKLEVAAILHEWDPDGNHHVRVDAGKIRFNLWGWRYAADTPRHVKLSLLKFDKARYEEIRIRKYKLHCHRTTKIVSVSEERRDQINAARRNRAAAGRPDRKYGSMRDRVVGFSSIV